MLPLRVRRRLRTGTLMPRRRPCSRVLKRFAGWPVKRSVHHRGTAPHPVSCLGDGISTVIFGQRAVYCSPGLTVSRSAVSGIVGSAMVKKVHRACYLNSSRFRHGAVNDLGEADHETLPATSGGDCAKLYDPTRLNGSSSLNIQPLAAHVRWRKRSSDPGPSALTCRSARVCMAVSRGQRQFGTVHRLSGAVLPLIDRTRLIRAGIGGSRSTPAVRTPGWP